MIEPGLAQIQGFVKVYDPNNGEIFVDKKNAIHYENISIAMAQALSNRLDANGARLGIIYSTETEIELLKSRSDGSDHEIFKISW